MSKSLNNVIIPALGGTALVLGVAYGVASRGYGEDKIAMLEDRVAQVEANREASKATAAAETARAAELEARAAELEASAADTEAKAVGLEQQIATLQAAVAAAQAAPGDQPAPAPLPVSTAATTTGSFGLGREAMAEEIAAWDVDVRPDGSGLPDGSGDVFTGEEVFAEKCAICHGDFAEGVDNWPKLAGGMDTLDHEDPLKTVGSYWPYLSTTWDYVNRSMPFGAAQTLTADEVYAIVAYILYSNDLVDDEFELSKENFLSVDMPNKDGFILDDRLTSEAHFVGEPCMSDCKESVEITMRAMVLDVTPEETAAASEGEAAVVETAQAETEADPAPVEEAKVEEVAQEASVQEAALDPELVAKGEKTFKKCKACHQVGDGAKNKTGPTLNGIVGAAAGAVDGFKYSKVLKAAADGGLVWSEDELGAFLAKPKAYMKGTKMSFAGLKKDADIEAVIAYLKSFPQ